jgi:hypothetical protein
MALSSVNMRQQRSALGHWRCKHVAYSCTCQVAVPQVQHCPWLPYAAPQGPTILQLMGPACTGLSSKGCTQVGATWCTTSHAVTSLLPCTPHPPSTHLLRMSRQQPADHCSTCCAQWVCGEPPQSSAYQHTHCRQPGWLYTPKSSPAGECCCTALHSSCLASRTVDVSILPPPCWAIKHFAPAGTYTCQLTTVVTHMVIG